MRSFFSILIRCRLSGLAAGGLLAVLFLLLPTAGHAQEGTPPPLQPAETPPPRVVPRSTPVPEPATETPPPAATPTPRVRVHRDAAPTPASDEPVAVVNGAPVYRPLFHSVVDDPVNRALVLQEYRHRGYVLPANALDEAMKTHTKTGFGDQATLIGKLHDQGASFDDYRAFVAEEVKLSAMLAVVSKGGRTDADRKTLRDNWIADLRKKANINKPKKA